jgi:hypothetical protein
VAVRASQSDRTPLLPPVLAKTAVSLAAAAALSLGQLSLNATPAAADNLDLATEVQRVETVDKELKSSFDVDFGGVKVNHKDLIYGVFVGQVPLLLPFNSLLSPRLTTLAQPFRNKTDSHLVAQL